MSQKAFYVVNITAGTARQYLGECDLKNITYTDVWLVNIYATAGHNRKKLSALLRYFCAIRIGQY